jgi:hypothetical protein
MMRGRSRGEGRKVWRDVYVDLLIVSTRLQKVGTHSLLCEGRLSD